MTYLLLLKDLDNIEKFPNFDHGNWMQNNALHGIEKLFIKGFNRSPLKELGELLECEGSDVEYFEWNKQTKSFDEVESNSLSDEEEEYFH